jgi:aryl-alcohol dehydrogenase-like predicted oxidoreductase
MLDSYRSVAEAHDCTFAQLAIAWTVHQPGCSHALVGARDETQVLENAVGGQIDLNDDELATIDAAIKTYRAG